MPPFGKSARSRFRNTYMEQKPRYETLGGLICECFKISQLIEPAWCTTRSDVAHVGIDLSCSILVVSRYLCDRKDSRLSYGTVYVIEKPAIMESDRRDHRPTYMHQSSCQSPHLVCSLTSRTAMFLSHPVIHSFIHSFRICFFLSFNRLEPCFRDRTTVRRPTWRPLGACAWLIAVTTTALNELVTPSSWYSTASGTLHVR